MDSAASHIVGGVHVSGHPVDAWSGAILNCASGGLSVAPAGQCAEHPPPPSLDGLLDVPHANLLAVLPSAVRGVEDALAAHGRVLLQCAHGHSRSPAVAIAWLVWRCRLRLPDALALVRDARPSVAINAGFLQQLRAWERLVGSDADDVAAAASWCRLHGLAAARAARGAPCAGFAAPHGAFLAWQQDEQPARSDDAGVAAARAACAAALAEPPALPLPDVPPPPPPPTRSLAVHCGAGNAVLAVGGHVLHRHPPPCGAVHVEPLAWMAGDAGGASARAAAGGGRWPSYAALPDAAQAEALLAADGGRLTCPHAGCGHKVGAWRWSAPVAAQPPCCPAGAGHDAPSFTLQLDRCTLRAAPPP
jgi:hypothetical protein